MKNSGSFQRFQLLTGASAFDRVQESSVILFGIGGVGSWCAEALIRSGIGKLTIVDSDKICVTNINRQLQATWETVGKSKVEVLRERLLSLNPEAAITAIEKVYDHTTAESFNLHEYDYCIDAIDSLTNKINLIMHAYSAGCKLFSALGASCKLDATRIKISSIWKSERCHLGRLVRKKLRQRNFSGDFTVVFSDELVENMGEPSTCGTTQCVCPKFDENGDPLHEWCSSKKQINGSAVHITGIFGFHLAGLIIQDIIKKENAIQTPDENNLISTQR